MTRWSKEGKVRKPLLDNQKLFSSKAKNFFARINLLLQKAQDSDEQTFNHEIWITIKSDHEEVKGLYDDIVTKTEETDIEQYNVLYKDNITKPFNTMRSLKS